MWIGHRKEIQKLTTIFQQKCPKDTVSTSKPRVGIKHIFVAYFCGSTETENESMPATRYFVSTMILTIMLHKNSKLFLYRSYSQLIYHFPFCSIPYSDQI